MTLFSSSSAASGPSSATACNSPRTTCGSGRTAPTRLRARGLAADDLAAAIGTAPAVNRALPSKRSRSARPGRASSCVASGNNCAGPRGVVTVAATIRRGGRPNGAGPPDRDAPGAVDVGRVTDKATGSPPTEAGDIAARFRAAVEQAGRSSDVSAGDVQSSSRDRGVSIFGPDPYRKSKDPGGGRKDGGALSRAFSRLWLLPSGPDQVHDLQPVRPPPLRTPRGNPQG